MRPQHTTVNTPLIKERELHIHAELCKKQAPLGDEKWQVATATKHDLLATLNTRGET